MGRQNFVICLIMKRYRTLLEEEKSSFILCTDCLSGMPYNGQFDRSTTYDTIHCFNNLEKDAF